MARWKSSAVQALRFPKDMFTRADAKEWAKRYGFKYGDVESMANYWSLRQFDPNGAECRYFRIPSTDVDAIVCETVQSNPAELPGDRVLAETPDGLTLGVHQTGPMSYPMRPFFIRMPSGLRHWFQTLEEAYSSQYWPYGVTENPVQQVGDPRWLEHDGKTVTIDRIKYKIKVSSYRARYPYPHDVITVDAVPVNKRAKHYLDIKRKLGDDWVTDVLGSPDFEFEVMKQVGFTYD